MFTYEFGTSSSADPVNFDAMYQAARHAVGDNFVKVWAHNVSDFSVRSSVIKRCAAPHPRIAVNMQITLVEDSDSAVMNGAALCAADLASENSALTRPVWHVVLNKREVKPKQIDKPLKWVSARRFAIDPGNCVRVTSALA